MRFAVWTLLLTGCQLVFKLEDNTPELSELYNPVFVTSAAHNGNLGGLAGADALCMSAAATAGIEGTFVAWLSTETSNAIDRLAGARGWARLDGAPVADLPTDLGVKGPLVPLSLTEGKDDVRGLPGLVFTGTQANGSTVAPLTCDGWTITDPGRTVRLGAPNSGGGTFTDVATFDGEGCDSSQRLYCFGIDRDATLEVPPPKLPIAFVSEQVFTPSSGRDTADAICEDEAGAAGLPGFFRAALGLSTQSIAERFDDVEYARPDGVRIGRLLSSTLLDTFINVTAAGQFAITTPSVWTGGLPGEVPSLASNCGDWSNVAGNGLVGELRDTTFAAFNVGMQFCNSPFRIYCLEQR